MLICLCILEPSEAGQELEELGPVQIGVLVIRILCLQRHRHLTQVESLDDSPLSDAEVEITSCRRSEHCDHLVDGGLFPGQIFGSVALYDICRITDECVKFSNASNVHFYEVIHLEVPQLFDAPLIQRQQLLAHGQDVPLEQERECLLQVSYFSGFDVLATSDSNKDFEEFKAAKCIVFILVHVDFFEVRRLEVRVNHILCDCFVGDVSLFQKAGECSPLDVRGIP